MWFHEQEPVLLWQTPNYLNTGSSMWTTDISQLRCTE